MEECGENIFSWLLDNESVDYYDKTLNDLFGLGPAEDNGDPLDRKETSNSKQKEKQRKENKEKQQDVNALVESFLNIPVSEIEHEQTTANKDEDDVPLLDLFFANNRPQDGNTIPQNIESSCQLDSIPLEFLASPVSTSQVASSSNDEIAASSSSDNFSSLLDDPAMTVLQKRSRDDFQSDQTGINVEEIETPLVDLVTTEVDKSVATKHSKRRQASSTKLNPSSFCHVCTRKAKNVETIVCTNFVQGTCRKRVCVKCAEKHGWIELMMQLVLPESERTWSCTHCRGVCPEKAQCNTYTRVNKRRKSRAKGSETPAPAP